MRIFFITTDHLELRIWFRDDEDFRVGMNYLAVTAAVTGLKVIAFILMSNHVHILLACPNRVEALSFINHFKQLYGTYYCNRYGERRFFRRNGVDIQEIDPENEGLERVIAYIVMNSVAARICASANSYRWGSGSCYFNDYKETGRSLSSYSGRSRIALLKSKAMLPGNWTVGAGGYVLPESYVSVKGVETLFKSPLRYNFFLNNSSKAKRVKDLSGPAFRDQVISDGFKDLCITLFNKQDAFSLSVEEKAEAVRQLRWRFGADSHQISRVTSFPYSEINEMLSRLP